MTGQKYEKNEYKKIQKMSVMDLIAKTDVPKKVKQFEDKDIKTSGSEIVKVEKKKKVQLSKEEQKRKAYQV